MRNSNHGLLNLSKPATLFIKRINGLIAKSPRLPATPRQLRLDLGIEVERDVNGIEMGVLENGMTYLTQRGLSAICGAARSTIQEISKEWEDNFGLDLQRGRSLYFSDYLRQAGYDDPTLYMEIEHNGTTHYAYPEVVCMAFIEFFAFEAQRTNDTAQRNFRKLARYGLNQFIYDALGYKPTDKWVYFNDRVIILQDSSPDGYFIVFKETTGMVVDLIRAGLPVNDKTIPDISVGKCWSKHWKTAASAKTTMIASSSSTTTPTTTRNQPATRSCRGHIPIARYPNSDGGLGTNICRPNTPPTS